MVGHNFPQWKKGIESLIIGATKTGSIDDAAGALLVKLTDSDVAYLEERYVPHPIVGAIRQNPEDGVILLNEKSEKCINN